MWPRSGPVLQRSVQPELVQRQGLPREVVQRQLRQDLRMELVHRREIVWKVRHRREIVQELVPAMLPAIQLSLVLRVPANLAILHLVHRGHPAMPHPAIQLAIQVDIVQLLLVQVQLQV